MFCKDTFSDLTIFKYNWKLFWIFINLIKNIVSYVNKLISY